MLEVSHLSKVYGTGARATRAIADISFRVEPGEFVCIVGPSGCGKTTLLKVLAGLLAPSGGGAVLNGTRIEGPPKTMALVFQEYTRSLLPWLSVSDNVTLPLRAKGIGRGERAQLGDEALQAVRLEGFFEHYPWQLSGGMQQRVAIARALAYQPEILLMDEPFASVDAQTRADLEDLVLRVRDQFNVTILFVTHDIDESVYLGDRVIVLTRAPTTVHREVAIPLPRPRDQVTTKETVEFTRLRTDILRQIRRDQPAATEVTTAAGSRGGVFTRARSRTAPTRR